MQLFHISISNSNSIFNIQYKLSIFHICSTLFFAFMLPAVQICFFCVAIGQKPSNLPFCVVNEEVQPFGSVCDYNDGCEFKNFSCRYLSALHEDPALNLLQYKDSESAINAVKDGTVWGMIHIGSNFTVALVKTVLP